MTEQEVYKQQFEAGEKIVKAILSDLASELKLPKLANSSFTKTNRDFDLDQVSLLDPETERVVAKLKIKDIADLPATPGKKSQVRRIIKAAVMAHYKI